MRKRYPHLGGFPFLSFEVSVKEERWSLSWIIQKSTVLC